MSMPSDEKLSFIFGRRSIRKYRDAPVSDELVTELLRAAMAAPSAAAKDPWRFVVVRKRATLNLLAEALRHGRMLAHAPVGIAVCGDLGAAHAGELSYSIAGLLGCHRESAARRACFGPGRVLVGCAPTPEPYRLAYQDSAAA